MKLIFLAQSTTAIGYNLCRLYEMFGYELFRFVDTAQMCRIQCAIQSQLLFIRF